ncbi:MAG: FAD-dependent oxidoreductase [SAR116 cluster bacterium]|nr:FAD-dependent oxidoreductase [SAR116 cluster bacterium]RPH00989.1 MAG: FAD-binding oxidoreductase [Candidatus Puniceispirillum sp. TMED176]HCA92581.1 FAD-dependent oxidoreductase [Alphaproteobacteria bacterium]|tara:strand:- start:605 stop:1909 length:1305 start_codon:yes stop_codon:yes gene_type:complete
MAHPDAIIIGTGVIGTATAFEMAKLGWKTISLDRNTQIGHGSTAGSCAVIRMHYSTFDGTAFAWEGYHYWRDWSEYLGLPSTANLAKFKECGCLVMRTETNGYLEKHLANSHLLKIPVEEWDGDQIEARLPIYSLESYAPPKLKDDVNFGLSNGKRIRGGVYWPNAGYVTDPALSSQNLADAASQFGAEFRLGVEVMEILQEGGHVKGVRLADGEEIHAPVVVNIAGPGSSHINGLAGVLDEMTIKTRPLRQEVAHVPAPEGFDFERRGMIVSDSDIAIYVRPEHGNNILIGSEDPACDDHVWSETDSEYEREFTDQWNTQVLRYGQRVPSLGIPSQTRGVVDLYDASTDWIPIYDKSSLDGYYMACGTSGNQYKNAPIAGKMMAALIDYCEAGTDHDSRPLTYRMPYTERDINVAFYSRKRMINQESSFSVVG